MSVLTDKPTIRDTVKTSGRHVGPFRTLRPVSSPITTFTHWIITVVCVVVVLGPIKLIEITVRREAISHCCEIMFMLLTRFCRFVDENIWPVGVEV